MSNKESLSDETPRSSNALGTPTSTTTVSSPWAAPKAPLAPHRLAMLANALGVSTPVPVHHRKFWDSNLSPSTVNLTTPDTLSFRRSPTPSTATSSYYPTTSKFLLHVIPPLHLPHDSALHDSGLTPPPSSASGYHTQFRRGTLVPVHATFQAQLWAIAKEYALPSITGIVLYLVANPQNDQVDVEDEPGPRLSEDIWKHLWTRVWKVEREDALSVGLPGSPGLVDLRIGMRSTPALLQDGSASGRSTPLRPFLSSENPNGAFAYPSPSTPSTASISVSRSDSKSTLSSFRSPTPGTSTSDTPEGEPGTPLTSDPDMDLLAHRANSLPLPGIHSPSIIPILAKVEFDIDKRKAAWYGPWLKSRKRNYKKRKGNANGAEKDDLDEKKAPIALKLAGRIQTSSPVSMFTTKEPAGYARLSDDDDEEDEPKDEAEEDEESSYDEDDDETARVASTSGPDLKSARLRRRRNPHDLALTGEELDDLDAEEEDEDEEREEGELTKNANEIHEIMASMEAGGRPNLSVSIPPSEPSTNTLARKNIPPPLVLHPVGGVDSQELTVPSPLYSATGLGSGGSSGSTSLPYLQGTTPQYEGTSDDEVNPEGAVREGVEGDEGADDEYTKMRSPAESEKRTGVVFDDLDLGLEASEEFDDDDPHDRRRSQYILSAKLDEIERNLAQLSPRALKIDLEDEPSFHARNSSFSSPGSSFLGLPQSGTPLLRNGDVLPPTPRNDNFGSPGERSRKESNAASISGAQWPAVPFASLNDDSKETIGSARHSGADMLSPSSTSSPPRLAVNGVTTSAPRAYNISRQSASGFSETSAETAQRRKALEEDQMHYRSSASSANLPYPMLPHGGKESENSPVIPLSPDPFGRFASTPDLVPNNRQGNQRQINDIPEEAPGRVSESSRFSADSSKDHLEMLQGIAKSNSGSSNGSSNVAKEVKERSIGKSGAGNRTTVMSMKSIQKLWRRSNKNSSISIPPTPSPASTSAPASKAPSPEPSLKTPLTPTFPPRTPSPQALQNLPLSSSSAGVGPPVRPARPSQEEIDIPDIPEQMAIPLQPATGRPSPMPIIAAQMQVGMRASGMSGMGGLRFDQESPYPIATRRTPSVKQNVPAVVGAPTGAKHKPNSSRAGSQIDVMNGATSRTGSANDSHRTSVRKSILKWKSVAAAAQNGDPSSTGEFSAPVRQNADRPSSSSTVRPRRPSLALSSQRSSLASPPPPDIPPSPQIPEQFLKSRGQPEHLRTGSQWTHLTSSSTDSRTDVSSFQSFQSTPSSQTSLSSPPRNARGSESLGSKTSLEEASRKMSMESDHSGMLGESEDDGDSDARPSIDSSQFEIVSPRMMVESLSYPYTTIGHQ